MHVKIYHMKTLMNAIGGSHLYGLAHANSDTDVYTVVDAVPTRKRNGVIATITEDLDTKIVDLSTFLRFADSGQPQALEMMFHQSPIFVGPLMASYRAGYRANIGHMDSHYRNIINRLDLRLVKHRRHGIRLALNLAQARRLGGRFNPALSDDDLALVRAWGADEATYRTQIKMLLR